MVNIIGIISFFVIGIFVVMNPTFTRRGGTTDLTYMNLNILIGFILISFGLVLAWSEYKRFKQDKKTDQPNKKEK